MIKTLFISLFVMASITGFSQNHQGYIYVLDQAESGEVYYMSPFLECPFSGDHDQIDSKRKSLDEQYEKYVKENYKLVEFQTTHNDWMMPGRGVFPERSYDQKIENLPIMREGSKVIIVSDFKIDCK